ncbi:DUF924 family protein [Alteromonadaceae bacterium BrNp21-10]|nr:DUF924 family protein [Alteromonadaceae bacterium BrNp21-10]
MYQQVISFWFGDIDQSKWWVKDVEFDQLIRDKFASLHQQACGCELYSWRNTAKGRLAEVIVLDQFSRNMYRDSPQAFSQDALALALAQEAISLGMDKQLDPTQRSFMYLPFMHSESATIHQVAMQLYTDNGVQSNLNFEIKHKDIIDRFGRYPHRNQMLGRESTAEEIAFLQQPGSSF